MNKYEKKRCMKLIHNLKHHPLVKIFLTNSNKILISKNLDIDIFPIDFQYLNNFEQFTLKEIINKIKKSFDKIFINKDSIQQVIYGELNQILNKELKKYSKFDSKYWGINISKYRDELYHLSTNPPNISGFPKIQNLEKPNNTNISIK